MRAVEAGFSRYEREKGVAFALSEFEDGEALVTDYAADYDTKRDKRYHGFGMKSMRRTVGKYGGSIVAGRRENWFELKILIPLKTHP